MYLASKERYNHLLASTKRGADQTPPSPEPESVVIPPIPDPPTPPRLSEMEHYDAANGLDEKRLKVYCPLGRKQLSHYRRTVLWSLVQRHCRSTLCRTERPRHCWIEFCRRNRPGYFLCRKWFRRRVCVISQCCLLWKRRRRKHNLYQQVCGSDQIFEKGCYCSCSSGTEPGGATGRRTHPHLEYTRPQENHGGGR